MTDEIRKRAQMKPLQSEEVMELGIGKEGYDALMSAEVMADLQRKWKNFLKEQDKKNAEQGKQTQVYKGN